jgi:hypothetical protein
MTVGVNDSHSVCLIQQTFKMKYKYDRLAYRITDYHSGRLLIAKRKLSIFIGSNVTMFWISLNVGTQSSCNNLYIENL